jgi:hypothetical protein
MYQNANTATPDGLKTVQEYYKNASRFEKVGLIWLEHVPNCRERIPMFQELSGIIQNHNDCSRVSPRIFKNHLDFSSRGHSGQKSGQ